MNRIRYLLYITGVLFIAHSTLYAESMTKLYRALKRHPAYKMELMQERFANLSINSVEDKFYPVIDIFANVSHYNAPTNLRPMSPMESGRLIPAKEPIPFAKDIGRYGMSVSMPLYIKELYLLMDKAEAMAMSSRAKKRLSLLQNEALLTGLNANWLYLRSLKRALKARKISVMQSYRRIKTAVKSGKMPGIADTQMQEAINALDIAINNIELQESDIASKIEALCGISLTRPVKMRRAKGIKSGEFFALKPLSFSVLAKEADIQVAKDKLYPKISLSANWSENYGREDDYMGESVHRSYGDITLGVKMPLFDKSIYTDIEKARVRRQKEALALQKKEIELKAQVKSLKKSMSLLSRNITLGKKSVKSRQKLLDYAKVALKSGRITREEYLRYESALLESQSKVYEAQAKYWQSVAQLAVIYGNDLEDMIR